ncbi:MAG: o-succinylbenzoate synthase [Flavobacteriaceae bacterium]|nr:o-succinylbenzoate synthase [Flavobacteriaceae bacterium]
MKARAVKHTLLFKRPSGTSRGVLTEKDTYFLILEANGKQGIGECGLLKGLSIDDVPEYEAILEELCNQLNNNTLDSTLIKNFPSLQMGLEMAQESLQADSPFLLYPSDFTKSISPIPINGLVWMGEFDFMQAQIEEKLTQGFRCVKLKIGALDFSKELLLLEQIRKHFTAQQIEIRVDANGAFSPESALDKLKILAQFELHSIEQPIAAGQHEQMRVLCEQSPLSIALDEELIGVSSMQKEALLDKIRPQYIILKPSLLGGFVASLEWIQLAEARQIGWWVTSALESNIGLNAIAQWTATLTTDRPQGLGTGGLYTNNIPSPLVVENGYLRYDSRQQWQFNP